jgi:hypothetical protein
MKIKFGICALTVAWSCLCALLVSIVLALGRLNEGWLSGWLSVVRNARHEAVARAEYARFLAKPPFRCARVDV